jgi:hypothetical protein
MVAIRDLQLAAAQADAGRAAVELRGRVVQRDAALEELEAIAGSWNALLATGRFEPESSGRWAQSWRRQDGALEENEENLRIAQDNDADMRAAWSAATHNHAQASHQRDFAARRARNMRDEAQMHDAAERTGPVDEEEDAWQ